MKAFKNRLEEMAEATVNALDYSDSKVEYPDDEPKKCKSVTVII
nr:MAG: hypothetical protein [Bacteriophage sp.]